MISSEEHVFPLNMAMRRYPSLPSAPELRCSGASPWRSRRQRLVFFQSAAFLFVTAFARSGAEPQPCFMHKVVLCFCFPDKLLPLRRRRRICYAAS